MVDELTDEEKQAENERIDSLQAKQEKNLRRGRPKKEELSDITSKRGIQGDNLLDCIAVRRIGIDNGETCLAGEEIYLPKEIAKRLQDAGAIKVKL